MKKKLKLDVEEKGKENLYIRQGFSFRGSSDCCEMRYHEVNHLNMFKIPAWFKGLSSCDLYSIKNDSYLFAYQLKQDYKAVFLDFMINCEFFFSWTKLDVKTYNK